MPEPATLTAVVAKFALPAAKAAAKAVIGELAKSLFFGSDKKKLKKALEEISRQLAIINQKLDDIYDLALDIRKSIEELKALVEEIPGITNTKNAHVTFATLIDVLLRDLSSVDSDTGTPGKDTDFLKGSFQKLREARGVFLVHRMDLSAAIHSSTLDILYFFYSDLQITLGFVREIWGDGKDFDLELRKHLSDFVASYEPVLVAISNPSGTGSLDIHLAQIEKSLELIAPSIQPTKNESWVTFHQSIRQNTQYDSKGEITVFAWRTINAVTVSSKDFDFDVAEGRPLIGVNWVQFAHTETHNIEVLGTDIKTRFQVISQSRLSAGENSFHPTSLSETEIRALLELSGAISQVATPDIQLAATNEFLLNVEKHNSYSFMAATLEGLKDKVQVALSIIQDDDFRSSSLIPQLKASL